MAVWFDDRLGAQLQRPHLLIKVETSVLCASPWINASTTIQNLEVSLHKYQNYYIADPEKFKVLYYILAQSLGLAKNLNIKQAKAMSLHLQACATGIHVGCKLESSTSHSSSELPARWNMQPPKEVSTMMYWQMTSLVDINDKSNNYMHIWLGGV